RTGAGGERGVEWPHGVHDREACPDRPFRVVLARGGPAEVDEQAIAEFPGDVAAEAPDGPRGGLLVLRDEVAPLLGVELLRERRRAHEVAEEDGELTALAGRYRGVGRGRRRATRAPRGREPRPAPAAELLAGLARRATRRAERRERDAAFRAKAPFRAVPVVTGRAAHRVCSRVL